MGVTEASTIVRWYAYAGCLAVVPLGAYGLSVPRSAYGLALPWFATALGLAAVLAAWALLLTMIRPVATRLPMFAVWVVAVTAAAYGTARLALDGAVTPLGLAAGGYGWALAVAALSYQRRYRAAVRSAASATIERSSAGATISASGPRASSWV